MPTEFRLNNRLSCQALSNNWQISRKTGIVSKEGQQSKDLKVWWVIDNNWLPHESDEWKPDWCWFNNFCSRTNLNIALEIIFSKIFSHIGSNEKGYKYC